VATSDIDIVCHAVDLDAFAETLWKQYRDFRGFRMHQWTSKGRPIVARFDFGDWVFELFGDVTPAGQQPAWRHFDVERRLLRLDDGRLRAALVRLRANGQKTEPAFATALGLDGDPYEAMLRLELEADSQLYARIEGLEVVPPIEGPCCTHRKPKTANATGTVAGTGSRRPTASSTRERSKWRRGKGEAPHLSDQFRA
jgi:Domain of unknown function (DUF4269)